MTSFPAVTHCFKSALDDFTNAFLNSSDSRTITFLYMYGLTYSMSYAVWGGSILSAYIFLVTNSSLMVGGLLAVSGLAQIIFSPIIGYLGDKFSRSFILKITGILGIFNAVLMLIILLSDSIYGLYGCMFLWGVYRSAAMPVTDALVADVVPAGGRSLVCTTRFAMQTYGSGLGPLASVIMFLVLGNHWNYVPCRAVISFGLVLTFIPSYILTMFEREFRKNIDGEGNTNAYAALATISPDGAESKLTDLEGMKIQDLTIPDDHCNEEKEMSWLPGQEDGIVVEGAAGAACITCPPFAPSMLVLSDILAAFAAGMSVSFFPIFFMTYLSWSPIAVTMLYMVTTELLYIIVLISLPNRCCPAIIPCYVQVFPFVVSKAAILAQKMSISHGRLCTILSTKLVGILCFLLFIYMSLHKQNEWVIVALFIFRTACMNSSRPLAKSILMDLVPEEQRSRWFAFDSINNATWCGEYTCFEGLLMCVYDVCFTRDVVLCTCTDKLLHSFIY